MEATKTIIQRTHFIGDTHAYRLNIITKYRQAELIIPIKRAEDKTIDGYTIDSTPRYKNIKIVFKADTFVPITYFEMIYVYSNHNWCIDCDIDFMDIVRIEVK